MSEDDQDKREERAGSIRKQINEIRRGPTGEKPSTNPRDFVRGMGPMQFSLQHARDVVGNHVEVRVTAEGGERIVSVATTLDGDPLAQDPVSPPAVQYHRSFRQVGNASPGRQHLLQVTAVNEGGASQSAEHRWEDES